MRERERWGEIIFLLIHFTHIWNSWRQVEVGLEPYVCLLISRDQVVGLSGWALAGNYIRNRVISTQIIICWWTPFLNSTFDEFVSFGYIHSSRTAEPNSKYISTFYKLKFHIVFQSGSATLYSRQQFISFPFPISLIVFIALCPLDSTILAGM